jgi:hypothetical protein
LKEQGIQAPLYEQVCLVTEAALFLGSPQPDWIAGVILDINGGILIC